MPKRAATQCKYACFERRNAGDTHVMRELKRTYLRFVAAPLHLKWVILYHEHAILLTQIYETVAEMSAIHLPCVNIESSGVTSIAYTTRNNDFTRIHLHSLRLFTIRYMIKIMISQIHLAEHFSCNIITLSY